MCDANKNMYLLGCDISHSKSPQLWSQIFDERNLDWTYELADKKTSEEAVEFIKDRNFRAINITTPYKKVALEQSDEQNKIARFCGGCNFLINTDGKLYGYNTDGYGCVLALLEVGHDVCGSDVVVCGSGPTARSIASAVAESGGNVTMLTRDASNVEFGCEILKNLRILEYKDADCAIRTSKIIVNATTLGMKESDGSPISKSLINSNSVIYDCVYGHGVTRLNKDCQECGATYYSGDKMLFWQAKKCEEILFAS